MVKSHVERFNVLTIHSLLLFIGTYHSARNLEPCLSYSRFHVDQYDLLSCLNSWMTCDSPTIHHKEIIWNASIELINLVDIQASSYNEREITNHISNKKAIEIRDAFNSLSQLRHVIQTIINMGLDSER